MDIFFIYTILNLIGSKLGCKDKQGIPPVDVTSASTENRLSSIKKFVPLPIYLLILTRILYVAINGQTQTNQANIEHFIFLITASALLYVDKNDISNINIMNIIIQLLYKIALYIVAPIVLLVLVLKDVNWDLSWGSMNELLGHRILYTLLIGSGLVFLFVFGIPFFLKCDNTWRDTFIKLFQFGMLGGWIYLFISLFTYSLTSVSFLMIPIVYLIISAIYIFITHNSDSSKSGSTYVIIAGIFATIIYSLQGSNLNLTIQGVLMFIASLFTGWYLSNINSLSHIPSLLFLSITFMIISTMMILISYNVYKTEYKNKTGDDSGATNMSSYYKKKTGDDDDAINLGKYNEYYDAYRSRMAWFTGSSILTTLGYSYYCNGLKMCIPSKQVVITTNPTFLDIWNNTTKNENLTWFFTNTSSLIMTFFASRELFNSSKFMYIKRSMAI